MNRLKGLRTYLAGPMDRCPNGGKPWRKHLTPFLTNLGCTVFDPTDKPISIGSEDDENRDLRRILKEKRDYRRLSSIVREISNVDLRMVDICDFLIVYLTLDIYPVGTIWEMAIANLQKKPILLCFEQGMSQIPDWFFGRLPWHEFFDNWNDLKNYLHLVAYNEDFNPGKRWYFFHKDVL